MARNSTQSSPGSAVPLAGSDDPLYGLEILKYLGLKVVAPPERGVYSVSMPLGPAVANLAGHPHGGAIASLVDHAGGHASRVLTGRGGPTVDLHVRYLTTPRDSTSVRADARIIREGRMLVVVQVDVYDEHERLLATGSLTVAPRPGRPEPSPD
jgi:uncharacterized protein (TIGR00369 family)